MMTTAEAAEQLKITKRSVARLCKKGVIKAELRGRDYWIEENEVERYKRERRPAHRPANVANERGAGSETAQDTASESQK